MNLYTIICEDEELNELNLGLTKKGRDLKRADKATKGSLKDEVRNLEVELLTYMKNSGNKKATPDLLKKYLGQKGLSKVGNPIVDQVAAKNQKPGAVGMDNPREEPPVSSGGNAAPPVGGVNPEPEPTAPAPSTGREEPPVSSGGNAAPPVGGVNPEPTAPAPSTGRVKPETGKEVIGDDGVKYRWMGNGWRNMKNGRMVKKADAAALTQKATQQNNSMYEADANEVALSKRQVRNIIKQVITKAYGDKAGFTKSKFGTDSGSDQQTQAMISALQDQGYKVTK